MGGCSCSTAAVAPPDGDEIVPTDDVVLKAMEGLMAAAVACEPDVTALLLEVAAANNGKMDGLDYKFKSRESLLRKINKVIDNLEMKALEAGDKAKPVDPHSVVWLQMCDSFRYTMIVPTATYTNAVKQTMKAMEKKGFAPIALRNYWGGGDGYQGINDNFAVPWAGSPDGKIRFELQFHTPESFKYKMDSHDLYEVIRAAMDPDKKREAWELHCSNASKIPVPEGVLDIPEKKNYSLPCDRHMYAELVVSRAMKRCETLVLECEKIVGLKPESILMSVSECETMLQMICDLEDLDGGDGPDNESVELKVAVNRMPDALKLVFILPDEGYAEAAKEAATKLRGAGFAEIGVRNGWTQLSRDEYAGGTLGLRLLLATKAFDDSVAFTDDGHLPFIAVLATAKSAAAEAGLVECWSTRRSATCRGDFQKKLAELRAAVPIPDGAAELA
mmetsp:Transcript_63662/g.160677  ORF Transcript_63662/g.160677 Transcript_63662/m.160677 type:complete len:446 (-) Transcript_63662:99-1436(-)